MIVADLYRLIHMLVPLDPLFMERSVPSAMRFRDHPDDAPAVNA